MNGTEGGRGREWGKKKKKGMEKRDEVMMVWAKKKNVNHPRNLISLTWDPNMQKGK